MATLNMSQESIYAFLEERGYRHEIWDWNVGEKNFESWSPTYVKPRSVWDDLSSNEKPILIFAPRGVGKSALRVIMQHHLEFERGYLIIEHVAMDPILKGTAGDGPIPASAHLEAIVEQATTKLVGRVVEQDTLPNLSRETSQGLCILWEQCKKEHIVAGWEKAKRQRWKRFVGRWWWLRNMRRHIANAKIRVTKTLTRSPKETEIGSVLATLGELMGSSNDEAQNAKLRLEQLAHIVADFGCEKIVLAVNGLDEHPETHDLRSIRNINRIFGPIAFEPAAS